MRAYTIVTGVAFLLLALVHLARLLAEGAGPLTDPFFVVATLLALSLAVWAMWILRRAPR